MTPDTIHRLCQEIKHQRALLTVQESWLQRQPKSDTRDEGFRYINHKRKVLKFEEQLLITSVIE